MIKRLTNQQSPKPDYGVRHIESFRIDLPVEQIDLHKWITEMTELDYISYSPAHVAMNSSVRENTLLMTNVENIGTDTVVQHYQLMYHSKIHVQLYSQHSRAYIFRWFPVTVGVPWEMQIRQLDKNRCELVCLVGADYRNPVLKAAAWLNGLGGTFLGKHLRKEGRAFAKDIQTKFALAHP